MVDFIEEIAKTKDRVEQKTLKDERKWKFVWRNVLFFSVTHILSVFAIYDMFTVALWKTIFTAFILSTISNMGVTAGAHRLWTHKAYKAKLPLKIINLLMFTLSFQGSVFQWARDHRVHHKFCDTDADPHNATRGFFFSHIGWLLLKKHPDVTAKGSTVDMSDIKNDYLLHIQNKYYYLWIVIFSIAIPAYIPLLWGENIRSAILITVMFRHTLALHMIFLVNSAAHKWGSKPYDNVMFPAENKLVAFLATGEGFHNYHHNFPWDYRTAELGGYKFNISWLFIDLMAMIGWAYDLKTVPVELIKKRVKRTGDGTHPVWGWGDKDLTAEDKRTATILFKNPERSRRNHC